MTTSPSLPTIGVIGLGIMGAAMAKNLLAKGYPVTVYNRSADKCAPLKALGASIAATPAAAATCASIIVIIVTNPEAVDAVCTGPEGIFSISGKNKTIIQSSTLSVESTVEIGATATAHGYQFLDAPVSGSKKQVEAAELIYEVGGDAAVLDAVRPVLLAMGKEIVHVGEIGAGTTLKLCMNLIVAQMTTAIAEAVTLATKSGINPEKIFEVLSHSPALNCVYYQIKREPFLTRKYPPAFSLSNMLKDLRFMLKEAERKGVELPVTQAVEALMSKGVARGEGEKDLAVVLEDLLGR